MGSVQSKIPLGTLIILVILCVLIGLPLTTVGTILGRHWSGIRSIPCRINQMPRHIPLKPWYMNDLLSILIAGALPFSSMFIEVFFLFSAVWHYKFYYVYGYLWTVFGLLLVVVSCTSIVSTYFVLNIEDYRWHWKSFLSGASTGLYIFLYSVHYFLYRTSMSGIVQTSLYFGYVAIFSFAIGLLCGSTSYFASSWFVRKIYANVKMD